MRKIRAGLAAGAMALASAVLGEMTFAAGAMAAETRVDTAQAGEHASPESAARPAGVPLFAAGLAGLVFSMRRRKFS